MIEFLAVVGALSVICTGGFLSLVFVDVLRERFRPKKPESSPFYCERCEQQTVDVITSTTAAVIVCRSPTCGFRRLLRDELHPSKVGVLYDPGART